MGVSGRIVLMDSMDERAIDQYVRAADYLSVAQVFLRDNFLLERPLEFGDVKPRLLGHFGTCPGINRLYANVNLWMKKRGLEDVMFVLGPGHGFAALNANLWMEGSLEVVDERAGVDAEGLGYLVKQFSWPYGFNSHSSPMTPGVILEGGELGYSLSTAYGAVLDNPGLVAVCMIGDGEFETGAALSAMNLNKLVSARENGVVVPVLHLNGYKIGGPTVYGRMSDKELVNLISGFGYEPVIVGEDGLAGALEFVSDKMTEVKGTDEFVRMPFIVLKTEKGEGGLEDFRGEKIAGNCSSHQVILSKAKTDEEELGLLEMWLRSYRFEELFGQDGFGEFLERVLPDEGVRMGRNRHTFGRKFVDEKLVVPGIDGVREVEAGVERKSSMKAVGEYLRGVMAENQEKFRFFCPDETESNKLGAIYEVADRSWMMDVKEWDKNLAKDGRVMELLSEQTLQGVMAGYVLTGRNGVMASYEAFMPIVSSMVDQYVKFLAQSRDVEWRGDVASLNYILTSVGWRQDHNGYSHQNPSFISGLLDKPSGFTNILLPVDDVATAAAMEFCLKTKNVVNVLTAGKTDEPRWIDSGHAKWQLTNGGGASVFGFASDDGEVDVVVAGAGDYVSTEALRAMEIVRAETPEVRMRFVGVAALSYGAIGTTEFKLSQEKFDELFTVDRPIVMNFHGYTSTMRAIMGNYTDVRRVSLRGYDEKGATTTPYDMQVRNGTSRWQVAMEIWWRAMEVGALDEERVRGLVEKYEGKLREQGAFIRENGEDMLL